MRPHMQPNKTGYPQIGMEIFTIYKESDKTVRFIDRARE